MMIMAEKITMLRKRSGWSQEELAEKLGVSRQAVSKWESGASLPDLDRMVKMSQLFCVSTDYLLKDEIEEVTLPEGELALESGGDYVVTLEEANAFLDLTRQLSARIAMAVALCILSPICLIQLAGVAEYKGSISEVFATYVGVSALLVLVGIGVAILLFNGMKLSPYQHIEKELLSLQYGVSGVVQRRKEADEPAYRMSLVVGVVLCILSVVPLLLTSALNLGDYISICCVNVLLTLVAAAVFLFVRFGSIHSSYQEDPPGGGLHQGTEADQQKAGLVPQRLLDVDYSHLSGLQFRHRAVGLHLDCLAGGRCALCGGVLHLAGCGTWEK